uniref:Uncharacterized protein n=1 Tax=Rhizophora mucronata TaxID=61149 RepID=A0A2P2PWM0_RHIMU
MQTNHACFNIMLDKLCQSSPWSFISQIFYFISVVITMTCFNNYCLFTFFRRICPSGDMANHYITFTRC